jgi:hypothetical protein
VKSVVRDSKPLLKHERNMGSYTTGWTQSSEFSKFFGTAARVSEEQSRPREVGQFLDLTVRKIFESPQSRTVVSKGE